MTPELAAIAARYADGFGDIDQAADDVGYLLGLVGVLAEGPDLVFSTTSAAAPAPEGVDTDCMFLSSGRRISVHVSRRAINAQVSRQLREDAIYWSHRAQRDPSRQRVL